MRFSPNSKFLFTSTLDSAVRLWDYQNDKVVKSYEGHQNRKCVPLSPSSPPSPLLGATRPRALERLTRPPACRYCIPPILTPDGAHLVCGSEDHKVVVWDVQTREVVAQWAAHKGEPCLSSLLSLFPRLSRETERRATLTPSLRHADVVMTVAHHPTLDILATGALEKVRPPLSPSLSPSFRARAPC